VKGLLLAAAFCLQAESTQPDTQALVASLKASRTEPGLATGRFRSIQAVFLEWIDVRLRNRDSINALNRELADAGVFDPAHGERANSAMSNFTGFLDEIHVETSPDDLLALRLGIGTTCSFDETIVLYQRQPWKRIGWLDHGDVKDGVGYVFSAFTIGPKDVQERRLVVAAEYDKWCTSTLIRANFRIESLDLGSFKPILNRDLDARRDIGDPVRADIGGNIVTFHYLATLPPGLLADAVQRYSVHGTKAAAVSAPSLSPYFPLH
jgi:hypothetical protein